MAIRGDSSHAPHNLQTTSPAQSGIISIDAHSLLENQDARPSKVITPTARNFRCAECGDLDAIGMLSFRSEPGDTAATNTMQYLCSPSHCGAGYHVRRCAAT